MHKIGINSLADYIVLSYASQLNRNNIIRALGNAIRLHNYLSEVAIRFILIGSGNSSRIC